MGLPAARIADMHVCPMVTGVVPHVGGPILPPGALTVLIGGLPAARVADLAICVGPPDLILPPGAPTVLIGGLPAARMGDMTAHGGVIVLGCFTVLIGTEAGGGAGGSGASAPGGGAPGAGGGGGGGSGRSGAGSSSPARHGGGVFPTPLKAATGGGALPPPET